MKLPATFLSRYLLPLLRRVRNPSEAKHFRIYSFGFAQDFLRRGIETNTFKQSGLTLLFTVVNGLLGLVFYIYLARILGPSDFGLFSLSIVVLAVVADIGNMGINTGIVNFVSKYLDLDPKRSLQFLKLGLFSKLAISVVVILLGYLLSPFISSNLFSKPVLMLPLRLVFIGVGTTWLFSFTTSYYQAMQKFFSWGTIQVFTNLIRLSLIIFFGVSSELNLILALIIYIIAPLIGFIIGFINISIEFFREKIDQSVKSEFFSYNKWVAVFSGVSALSSRSDTFVLGRLVTAEGIGLYSAANQMVQVIPQLIGAIGTVVAPKYSSFGDLNKMLAYFKKLQIMVVGIALIILLSTPLVRLIMIYFLGAEYSSSFSIFILLLLAMLIFLVSVPLHNAIIYYFSYPKLFSYLSVLNLIIVFPLAYFLTFRFGVFATPYAVICGNLVNFVIPYIWFTKRIRKNVEK